MEGKKRPRQRAPEVLRAFNPTRLQDDLLAAVYDRVLNVGARVKVVQDELRERQLKGISAEQGQLAKTGGRHG
jgi:hypothetical protein